MATGKFYSSQYKKTELLIFRHPKKIVNYDIKIKLHGKRLYPSLFVKYLGVLIDCHLNFKTHMLSLGNKLSRAQGMLCKLRQYVNTSTLRSIYFSIFSSILTYASTIWGQSNNKQYRRIEAIQNKTVKIISFANHYDSPSLSYKNLRILKLRDHVRLHNFLFAHDCFNKHLPPALNDSLVLVSNIHNYDTRASRRKNVFLPSVRTSTFGLKSILFQSGTEWNNYINKFNHIDFHQKGRSFCKQKLVEFFLDRY